jgi:hypothetical protein
MSSTAASSWWATIRRAFSAIFSVARAAASVPTAVDREPYVPSPCGPVPVSPWMISTLAGSTPSRSATTWAIVVSCPWPCGEVPVKTVTAPVMCTRTIADSHRPVCRPKPDGPVTREGASPQISV